MRRSFFPPVWETRGKVLFPGKKENDWSQVIVLSPWMRSTYQKFEKCVSNLFGNSSVRERCEKPQTNFTISDKLTKVSMSISSDSNKSTYSGRPSCVSASERAGYDSSSSSSSELFSNSFGMSLLPGLSLGDDISLKRQGKNRNKSWPFSSLNRPLSMGSYPEIVPVYLASQLLLLISPILQSCNLA